MTRKIKAADYTHSVWSGTRYDRPQTEAQLLAESEAVIARHPTLGKMRQRMKAMTSEDITRLCSYGKVAS